MHLARFALALSATVAVAGLANASPLVYSNFDTRSGGSFAPVASPTNDGNGSLQLIATSPSMGDPGNQGKVSVVFGRSDGLALGTLGQLQSLTFDFLKSSNSTTYPQSAPAVRLQLGSGLALVWERPYQTNTPTPTDVWQNDVNVGGGLFWQRANNTNYDGYPNFQSLSSWVGGYDPVTGMPTGGLFNANTQIFGIEIAFGSGINGRFEGYVDDVKVGFSNGTSYSADIAVATPEPATMALFGGFVVASGLVLRRRRMASA